MGEPDPQTSARSILGPAQSLRKVLDLPGDSFSFQNKENVTGGAAGDLILTKKKAAGEGAPRESAVFVTSGRMQLDFAKGRMEAQRTRAGFRGLRQKIGNWENHRLLFPTVWFQSDPGTGRRVGWFLRKPAWLHRELSGELGLQWSYSKDGKKGS